MDTRPLPLAEDHRGVTDTVAGILFCAIPKGSSMENLVSFGEAGFLEKRELRESTTFYRGLTV